MDTMRSNQGSVGAFQIRDGIDSNSRICAEKTLISGTICQSLSTTMTERTFTKTLRQLSNSPGTNALLQRRWALGKRVP